MTQYKCLENNWIPPVYPKIMFRAVQSLQFQALSANNRPLYDRLQNKISQTVQILRL